MSEVTELLIRSERGDDLARDRLYALLYDDLKRLASRAVTCGEYLEFMEAGGYDDPALWLSQGWQALREQQWRAPLYWERDAGAWRIMTLSGLRPGVDIDIVFSGVRPGEKLFEELFLEGENADRTSHPKILTARHQVTARERIPTLIEELRLAVARCDDAAVRRLVPRLVPEYQAGQFAGNVVPMAAARAELTPSVAAT